MGRITGICLLYNVQYRSCVSFIILKPQGLKNKFRKKKYEKRMDHGETDREKLILICKSVWTLLLYGMFKTNAFF